VSATTQAAAARRGAPVSDVSAARLWASVRMPYLASAVFACAVKPEPGIGTIRIDEGWTVHADPAVVASMSVENLGKLLLHLTCHALREHADRARALHADGSWWNRCTDAEINDDLAVVDAVPTSARDLPVDLGVAPHRLAEEYFAGDPQGARPWDCGSGADGSSRPGDSDGVSGLQAQLIRARTAVNVQDAQKSAPGSVPGGLLRWAHGVTEPSVDWRRVLAAELRRACAWASGQVDHSYSRPSRRASVMHPVVLPRLVRPVPEVAVVADTSGSIDDRMLATVVGEIDGIATRAGLRSGLPVVVVDAQVYTVRRVTRAAQLDLAGGGGTDVGAGIAAAAALRPRPSVIVVLTDGLTPWPDLPPRGTKVIVGLLGNHSAAPPRWARVVRIAA
jgi:predicted metal-dependent peptidase